MDMPLSYWLNNRIKVNTKNYYCDYKGIRFGSVIKSTKMYFVYKFVGGETVLGNGDYKNAYVKAVEYACSNSSETMNKLLNERKEKFSVFSSSKYELLNDKQKHSTRTANGKGKIFVRGEEFYVATNLNICEYYENLSNVLSSEDIANWFIRVVSDSDDPCVDSEEREFVELQDKDFILTEVDMYSPEKGETKKITKRRISINHIALDTRKKELGDLGERMVLELEIMRLKNAGRADLAEQVEHTALFDESVGYDIKSFTDDGETLYIEVKTTTNNKEDDFYISANELKSAEEVFKTGGRYCIYRVYEFNAENNTGTLRVYEAPLDQFFKFYPTSFRAKKIMNSEG